MGGEAVGIEPAGACFSVLLAMRPFGRQRPSTAKLWPGGQGTPQPLPRWLCSIARRTMSGCSADSVALTRSVKAFMERRTVADHTPSMVPW